MRTIIASLVVFASILAQAETEAITGVEARQRWPWNGIVDIDFTLNGKVGEHYRIGVEATSEKLGSFYAKTYLTEPVATLGKNRISWDFGRDYPGVKSDDVVFTVSAYPLAEDDVPTYMVIDVSGGKDAGKWPVRYTSKAPKHTPGCLTDKCKLSEIWLRRVHVKNDPFCSRIYKNNMGVNHFPVTLTKDFYIAVFPTTQQQWYLMSGEYMSVFATTRETRPVDSFYVDALYGYQKYYLYLNGEGAGVGGVNKGSRLDNIRIRTGLNTIDLPTEAQWVYALHGGPCISETYRYLDESGRQYSFSECARYYDNSGSVTDPAIADLDNGTASVGCYAPNVLGLYDMIGNVGELVKNPQRNDQNLKAYYDGLGATYPVPDPIEKIDEYTGSSQSQICYPTGWKRCGREVSRWRVRYGLREDYCPSANAGVVGFRFCVTVE
jgi:formylglycine-generating enzyme required for sulfatase activity